MTTRRVLGVDPGGKETGLVIRDGAELVWHTVIVGLPWEVTPVEGWNFHVQGVGAAAVELVTPPTGFAGGRRASLNPAGLVNTSLVAGYIFGMLRMSGLPTRWVPPGHNGDGPFAAYPEELRPTRGKGSGFDRLRHCRSAWDVAGVAARLWGTSTV